MRWSFRPFVVLVAAVALLVGGALALWPRAAQPPLPVPSGSLEVAWLYAATNSTAWERFVSATMTAVDQLRKERPEMGLEPVDVTRAFLSETTAVPEVRVAAGGGATLLFRWYKLTSEWKTARWVEALTHRSPPPLAIVGGSSSDPAIDLANCLEEECQASNPSAPPLLLLTTATAGEGVRRRDDLSVPLTTLYPGRTFRFAFTNRQMAEAVTRFVYCRDELRPDADPVYLAFWQDDQYSRDLTEHLYQAMRRPRDVRAAARDWAWTAGAATGAFPIDAGNWACRLASALPVWEPIYSSVGSFDQPNRWEADAARHLLDRQVQFAAKRPPLILAAGSANAGRRFLRGLVQTAPTLARRYVVTTGDGLSFNTVYRDRNVTWPIQDLPFDLVFFAHRNPADTAAGFRPEDLQGDVQEQGRQPFGTGTEDLLLFADIVAALAQAALGEGEPPSGGDELAERLRRARWEAHGPDGRVRFGDEGVRLFDDAGNRSSGTGGHVVWLQPRLAGERVLPEATLSIWSWQAGNGGELGGTWRLGRQPLLVQYEGARRE